jgi:hypothetical protein
MSQPTALILLTSHELQRRPSLWEHLEGLLDQQKKSLPMIHPIICVHGNCPEHIQEKYEIVLGDLNPYENVEQKFQLLSTAVDRAVNSGKAKTLITKYGLGVNNKKFFRKKLGIVGGLIGRTLNFDAIHCKTMTAARLMKYNWDNRLTDEANWYKMFCNVVGDDITKLVQDEENLWRFQYFSKDIVRFRNGALND